MRNTKIVCTLGPASNDQKMIQKLAMSGMSIARLNASHGSYEDRAELIDRIHAVNKDRTEPIAVMLDTKGPEIRTAPLSEEETISLEAGSEIQFIEGEVATSETIGLTVSIDAVEPGDQILLDDGLIETTVLEHEGDAVRARIDTGGELGSRKGVNVPGVELDLNVITEKDRADLKLAAEKEVDFIAASFVKDSSDIYEINEILEEQDADIPIVAKIERAGAINNLDEIIDSSYGVMVARGDLGVECPMEDVPMIQKQIIRKCREAGRPVVTATEMLDSMVHARRPTRAEASDVANAILDGTDAVMLSAETAVGDHPAAVVDAMDRIVRKVEGSDEYAELLEQRVPASGEARTDALARSARFLARDIDADVIIAATESGYTALKAAKYRPSVPVVASTPSQKIRRQLTLTWGVTPLYASVSDQSADAVIERAVQTALDEGIIDSGDTVIILCGMMTNIEGVNTTNMMKVHIAAEILTTGSVIVEGQVTDTSVQISDGDLSSIPDNAIIALSTEFNEKFTGDLSRVGGIISSEKGMTGYPAMIARELDIPMISGADLDSFEDGDTVTLNSERGVVYNGDIIGHAE